MLTWTGAVGRTSVISLPGINNEIACQRVREENHVLPMRRVHSERLGRTKQQWVRVQGSSTCQVLDGPPRLFGAPGHVLGEARRGTLILCRDLEGVNHKASAPRVPRALRHVACGNNSRVHHCAPKHVPAPAQLADRVGFKRTNSNATFRTILRLPTRACRLRFRPEQHNSYQYPALWVSTHGQARPCFGSALQHLGLDIIRFVVLHAH